MTISISEDGFMRTSNQTMTWPHIRDVVELGAAMVMPLDHYIEQCAVGVHNWAKQMLDGGRCDWREYGWNEPSDAMAAWAKALRYFEGLKSEQ